MAPWFWYAVVAAVLYGVHQIFTRMASDHIGDGIGGFVVEGAGTVAFFLLFQRGGPLSSVPVILAGGAAIMASRAFSFSTSPPRGSGFSESVWPLRDSFSSAGS